MSANGRSAPQSCRRSLRCSPRIFSGKTGGETRLFVRLASAIAESPPIMFGVVRA
jgi:hypothetical protein